MRSTSLFVGLIGAVAALAGCAPDSSPWGGAGGGAAPGRDPEALLRERFPIHAGDVLDQDETPVWRDLDILLAPGEEGGGFQRVSARLPTDGSGVVTMEVTGGFSVRVGEAGIAGRAQRAGNAISYRRGGGDSYWMVAGTEIEEWLSVDAEVVKVSEPVAVWEIEGGTLQQNGRLVHVLDERGFARMTVSAPTAYAGGEREVRASLVANGSRLELYTEADGEDLLVDPAWTAGAPMQIGRQAYALVKLNDNRILVTGGSTTPSGQGSTTEVYDPATGTWTLKASMAAERVQHTATLLSNGKVLVVGDCAAELYDPVANTWSAAGALSPCRFEHTATVLSDNRVLVAGGRWGTTYHTTVEIYNPATSSWSAAAPLSQPRAYHGAARLSDGRVLVAGGGSGVGVYLTTSQIYNPVTNAWSVTGNSLTKARAEFEAALLSSGKVMVLGGYDASGSLSSVESYDPVTNLWSADPTMLLGRWAFAFVPMGGGRYLAAGYSTAEVFDESTNAWYYAGALATGRQYVEGATLPGGAVLVPGGYNGSPQSTVDVFTPMAQGASCAAAAPGECQSLKCVDGKCCNTACTGTCVACSAAKKGSGSDGVCGNIGAALDPDGECAAQAQATCGTTGVCSGGGACQLHASGAVCVAASCNGSLATKADLCNGTGSCVDGGTQQCAPFGCSAGVCYASCSNDAQCASGNYCAAPSCLAQKALGSPCAAANQCQSGFCVDAVCCSSACGASCMACASSKTGSPDGACAFVSAGQDPDGECPDQGAASCGQNGSCNGGGSCGLYEGGTICTAPSCAGTVFHAVDLCDGSGSCVDGGSVDCEPYVCGPAGCAATCVGDIHCAADAYCAAPACVLKKPTGSACAAANQCQSAHCADGVCCDAACDGLCEACSAAKKGSGANGACGPVAPGADPDSECADAGVASCGDNGACDGSGACQKYALGEVCDPGSCDGTTWGGVAHCDGAGTCVTPLAEECWPFACGMAGCWETCSTDEQCAPDAFCITPGCHAKKAIGSPCASGNQCSSGSCADGVCCDNECDGPCEACVASKKGEGQDGLCGPVPAGIDPDNDCPMTGPTVCGNDGECDGAGACRKYAAGVECFAATCDHEKAQFTPPSECDGQSACIHGITQDCAPYSCDETGCLPACSSDAECAPAAYCDAPSCVDKKPAGDPCDGDAQCAGGVCENGVCCQVDCGGIGTGGTGGTGATGGASDEESKSFYACSAVPSDPGPTPTRSLLALASGLLLAVRGRRRAAPRPRS